MRQDLLDLLGGGPAIPAANPAMERNLPKSSMMIP